MAALASAGAAATDAETIPEKCPKFEMSLFPKREADEFGMILPLDDLATEDEKVLLQKMRKMLEVELKEANPHDSVTGDLRMLRFLRGHGTYQRAAWMLRKHYQWRKEAEVDKVQAQVQDKEWDDIAAGGNVGLLQDYALNLHGGKSKRGDLVTYERIGDFIPSNMFNAAKGHEGFLKVQIMEMEWMNFQLNKMSREQGRIVRQFRVCDLSGVGTAHGSPDVMKYLQGFTKIAQRNYPEALGGFIGVNVPIVFRAIFAVMRGWLHPRTVE